MAQVKYMAAGFIHDANKLLEDFIKQNSLDFSVFSEIWKKRMFSLIYMGRGSNAELAEFTQEIFCLSAQFLTSSPLINCRVGAIYLLYALYRNQIAVPLLRIRLLMSQWKVLMHVRETLDVNEHLSLHYVIDYMVEHSLDFVACSSLMGPNVPLFREKGNRDVCGLNPCSMTAVKSSLIELSASGELENMSYLFDKYMKTKSLISADGTGAGSINRFKEFNVRLQDLVGDTQVCRKELEGNFKTGETVDLRSVGSRRLGLKVKALSHCARAFKNSNSKASMSSNGQVVAKMEFAKSKRLGIRKNSSEGTIVKSEFSDKTNFFRKSHNRRQTRERIWRYYEQASCDDPKTCLLDMNLPLITDQDDPLSSGSENSEAIDAPDC